MAHSVCSTRTLNPNKASSASLNQPLTPYMIRKPSATVMAGMTKDTIINDDTKDFPGNERLAKRYPKGTPMTTLKPADKNACQAVKRSSPKMYGSRSSSRKRPGE